MKSHFIALLLLIAIPRLAIAAGGAPTINLGYVQYTGFQNATIGINYYRGLRYAQAPVGDLRWREPVPIEQSSNYTGQVMDASQYGPACYQGVPYSLEPIAGPIATALTQSEDCLLLDVLVPINPVSASLPVYVQIHGGGYTLGSSSTVAPGDAMVNASNGNIIYVQIQYRLGMHGFLGGSQVAQDGVRNAGLLDQRAALLWVQRNIRPFGGDPAKVTIIGGSAGGGSVTYQLIAGGAYDQPPFRAAVAEYPWWQPLLNDSSQELQLFNVLNLAKCNDLNCLRGLSSNALQQVHTQSYITGYDQPGYAYGVFYYGPVVDGRFVIELPDQAFKHGRFYNVPLIVDRDGYEGDVFSNTSQTNQVEETLDAEILFPQAGQSFFSRLYELYPASAYNSTFFQRQTWFGDFIINCPTYQMATGAVDNNSNGSAVFKMVFFAGSELHGASGAFLFSNVTGYPAANNLTIAEILTSYYVSFAVTLDPNTLKSANAPLWPPYISGGAGNSANGENVGFTVQEFTYKTIGPVPDPDAAPQCDFFSSRGLAVAN